MTHLDYYMLAFCENEIGQVDHPVWKHDPSVPEGEVLKRRPAVVPKERLQHNVDEGKQNLLGTQG